MSHWAWHNGSGLTTKQYCPDCNRLLLGSGPLVQYGQVVLHVHCALDHLPEPIHIPTPDAGNLFPWNAP